MDVKIIVSYSSCPAEHESYIGDRVYCTILYENILPPSFCSIFFNTFVWRSYIVFNSKQWMQMMCLETTSMKSRNHYEYSYMTET